MQRSRRTLLSGLALAAASGGLAACGSQPLAGGSAITTVPSPAASAVVDVRKVGTFGRVLVTRQGRALYLLTSDPRDTSNCTGYCAVVWPPLELKGKLQAGPGVKASLLSTHQRSGGAAQVFYAGHALYTYQYDTSAGMATGEGVVSYGGTWWLVSPDGKPVQRTRHP